MENAELIKALRAPHDWADVSDCMRYDEWMRAAADALEADEKRIAELETKEPTEKQVADYCQKRCLVIVTAELFNKMTSAYGRMPKEGEWIKCGRLEGKTVLKCSVCSQGITAMFAPEYHYCPNCGARMQTVTDCHTSEEVNR